MSKVLLFSDIHIFPHKRKNERLEDCLSALRWVFKTAESRGIKNLLFGGDFFHDRQKIDVYTYQKTFEILQEQMNNSDIELFLLLGNHDIWFNDNTSISSVFPLSALRGIHLVAKPERIKIGTITHEIITTTDKDAKGSYIRKTNFIRYLKRAILMVILNFRNNIRAYFS